MANDLFQNNTKSLPKSDPMIVRVDLDKSDIGGRHSQLPSAMKSDAMAIQHVPSTSTK